MTQKSLTAIYCDDIRNEVAGKFSLMGVYGHELIFPSFPAVLNKLHVHTVLSFPYGEQPKTSIKVIVLNRDETLTEFGLDGEALKSIEVPEPDAEIPVDERRLLFTVGFILSPFLAAEPTTIKIRAYIDGEEIKGNGLRVRLATAAERPALGFPPLDETNTPSS